MLENKIIELKKKICKYYELYLKSEDKKECITVLGKIFNIPIFKVLANNYEIKNIDIDNLSITIKDIRYGITYSACYTSCIDLVNYNSSVIRFIEVIESSNEKYKKKIYYIGDDKPIVSQMIFENNGYILEFTKEESIGVNTFLDNVKGFKIRLLEEKDGKHKSLFTQIEKRCDDDLYERMFTYDGIDYNNDGDLIDKSIYVKDNSIVYVIDELESELYSYIRGICIENTTIGFNEYKVNGINLKEFENIYNKDTISAFIFKGIVANESFIFEAYKSYDCISLRYRKHNNVIDNEEDIKVLSEEIELPILNSGSISYNEIMEIINSIKHDEVISIICNELHFFASKICIKDKKLTEIYEPLTPKILFNRDFELIADVIEKNKDEYIQYALNNFNLITGENYKKR